MYRLVVSGSRVVKCSASGPEIEPGGDGDDKVMHLLLPFLS